MNRKKIISIISICTAFGVLAICGRNINKVNTYVDHNRTYSIDSEEQMEEVEADKEKNKINDILKKESNDIAILVNKQFALETDYKPSDLVIPNINLYCPKGSERSYLRLEAAKALENLFKAAEDENMELYLVSAFRSSEYQRSLFNSSLNTKGQAHTEKYIAKPNHSEHQTGLVADISTREMNFTLEAKFKDTKEGKWLAQNAHKYGFILRYKEGREEDTGYSFEPWHFRYVGKELSKYIYDNNLILEDLYKEIS